MSFYSMMLLSILLVANSAFAMNSKISGHIAEVISFDSYQDDEIVKRMAPQYRFRAIRYEPIEGESGQWLVVEKLFRGDVSSPYKVYFSEKVETAVDAVMKKELKTMNSEQAMFCCTVKDLKWEGFKLKYKISIQNNYVCEIKDVNKSRKPICKKVK